MREVLEVSRQTEYFTREGLRTLTGLDEDLWDYAVFKELVDNALDAVDELREKRIDIELEDNTLAIYDNGPGISETVLDSIVDFNLYVSSKRHYRAATRGFQGNALKTIFGICHINDYRLEFITSGKRINYTLNQNKFNAGIVEFEKKVDDTKEHRNGVIVSGGGFSEGLIWPAIWTYYLCNPDVTFIRNGEKLPAISTPIKRTDKTFPHWYDLQAFNTLLQGVYTKYPDGTIRDFIKIFSGTQRIKIDLPHKKLSDIADDEDRISFLHRTLISKTKNPRPQILKGLITGQDTLFAIYGESEVFKHKIIVGEYQQNEAVIPYVIEGYLLFSPEACNEHSPTRVIVAVNNSIPYEKCPFYFGQTACIELHKRQYYASSLKSLLDQTGITGETFGLTLYINFISPHIEFTDKAKTQIITRGFRDDLIRVVECLCRDLLKEIQKVRRQRRAFDRRQVMTPRRSNSKKELMTRHFMESFNRASGGYPVTIRQIFYVAREIINRTCGIELNQSDYNSIFTQQIATRFIEQYPELESKILFERRGYFYNPFTGCELPLGTEDVTAYMQKVISNRIYINSNINYSIPDELQFNHCLFIEKQGFNIILKESGLLDELNLAVMSTQGFSTRAAKKLMRHLITKGIKLYLLHDCDVAGYLIADKIMGGSDTFKEGLEVERIGLTLSDVDRLSKRDYAEEVEYKRGYQKALDILTQEECSFLVTNRRQGKYRRVELNALTTPEFIQLIEDKIKYTPIKPTVEQIQDYIEVDLDSIIKEALFKKYGNGLSVDIDKSEIAKKSMKLINSDKHWTRTLTDEIDSYQQEKVDELVARL